MTVDRTSRRRPLAPLAVIPVLVVLLAGVTPVAAGQSPPDGRAQQDDIVDPLPADLRAWLDAHGPLRVGHADNPPVAIVEDGVATGGWAIEVMQLMALKLGIDVETVLAPSLEDAVKDLREGTTDVAVGFGPRPDLRAFATLGTPIGWPPVIAVVRRDDQASTLADLVGRSVTTIPGSPIEAIVAEELPDSPYVASDDIPSGIRAVVEGEVDAWVGPLAIVGSQLRGSGAALRPVGDPLSIVEVGAWTTAGSEAERVVAIGRDLITDAELQVIHVRWTGFDIGDPSRGDPNPTWLLPALTLSLALALLFAAFTVILRRRVGTATVELREANENLDRRVRERTTELDRSRDLLARSNRLLRDVGRRAAHDLSSPLRSIVGLSGLAQDHDDPERVREMLGAIEASGEKLAGYVDTLLHDAKSLAAEGASTVGSVEEELTAIFGPRLDATVLEVTEHQDPDALVPAVLRRALVNLVENALRYGGATIRVSVDHGDNGWQATVEDDGDGLGHDPQRHFRPGATAGKGTGAGLPTTRRELRERGGDVTATTSGLGGAAFTVRLP